MIGNKKKSLKKEIVKTPKVKNDEDNCAEFKAFKQEKNNEHNGWMEINIFYYLAFMHPCWRKT